MAEDGAATAIHSLVPPIRMEGVAYRQVDLRHPFAVSPPTGADWRLYVVRGHGVALETPALEAGRRALRNGAVIGMDGREPHRFVTSDLEGGNPGVTEWRERHLSATPREAARAHDVVVTVGRIPQSSMPFLSATGGFICIDPKEHRDSAARIGLLIDLIAEQTRMNDSTTAGVVQRLAEVITAEIGRVGRRGSVLFGSSAEGAEYDVRIWRAITAMCAEPQRRWTVDSLAQIAGMSRSAFASRYHETLGQTPMRSLRRLRMHRAATALAAPGSHTIVRIAEEMGYGSDAAFNRAFAKEFGHPPKRYGSASRFDAARSAGSAGP